MDDGHRIEESELLASEDSRAALARFGEFPREISRIARFREDRRAESPCFSTSNRRRLSQFASVAARIGSHTAKRWIFPSLWA